MPDRQTLSLDEYLALPMPDLQWVVPGLIPTQSFTILWGPPKSGKTLLSLQFALAIASGTPLVGYSPIRRSVLFVELDTGQRLFRCALSSVVSHTTPGALLRLPNPESLAAQYPLNLLTEPSQLYLHTLISETQPSLVIVDCLSELAHHDENEQKEVKPVVAALKHLTVFHPLYPCACLLLHHTVKFDYQNKQTPLPSPLKAGRGSGYLAGAADSVWFLHRLTSDQDPHAVLKIVPRFAQPQTLYLKQGLGGLWTRTA